MQYKLQCILITCTFLAMIFLDVYLLQPTYILIAVILLFSSILANSIIFDASLVSKYPLSHTIVIIISTIIAYITSLFGVASAESLAKILLFDLFISTIFILFPYIFLSMIIDESVIFKDRMIGVYTIKQIIEYDNSLSSVLPKLNKRLIFMNYSDRRNIVEASKSYRYVLEEYNEILKDNDVTEDDKLVYMEARDDYHSIINYYTGGH